MADTLAALQLVTDRDDDLAERRSATFDPARTYRYVLQRRWSDAAPAVFVMLNPSTADAMVDDPTIRRCLGFARRERRGGLVVVNLFALRATDPKALYAHRDPVGPANDAVLAATCAQADLLIAAWGAHGSLHGRDQAVARLLAGRDVQCLGTTKDGHPCHPLYLPADAPLRPYWERS